MEEYLVKDGKRLRLGYTTGSCAAAAAKAAAWMLLTGRRKESIRLQTPKGIELNLKVLDIQMLADEVRCAIRKDSGDDPDVTRGTLIFAAVKRSDKSGVTIDGGEGVGRVTKPGLDQPVGAAAINSVPRKMIEENVREVCMLVGYDGGIDVTISAPEGEALAKKTFNPRLGIEGGISILGTSGIVEPMSEQALLDCLQTIADNPMIELRAISEDNFRECLLLRASVENEDFVDPVTYSLAEAWVYYQDTRPFAIYSDDTIVGFVSMYVGEDNYQIINFLIDDAFQRKGYGSKAVKLCIEYLQREFSACRISAPVKMEHIAAQEFWIKQGFCLSDTIEDGYVFMRLFLT